MGVIGKSIIALGYIIVVVGVVNLIKISIKNNIRNNQRKVYHKFLIEHKYYSDKELVSWRNGLQDDIWFGTSSPYDEHMLYMVEEEIDRRCGVGKYSEARALADKLDIDIYK